MFFEGRIGPIITSRAGVVDKANFHRGLFFEFEFLELSAPKHFQNNGIDGNIFDIVRDTLILGSLSGIHEKIFESLDFFG